MPEKHVVLMWGLRALWTLLIFAYGACLGSLINVIVYRLPLGLSIVSPPSRCPSCNTRLTWRDNIPVFGWLFLKGKCRYCSKRISPEYPIVEAIVGLLFVGIFAYCYLIPTHSRAMFLGIDWVQDWYRNDAGSTWPTFLVTAVLVACLVAMTIIDARTFTIPALLTTVPVVVAVLVHPIHAAVVGILPFRAGTLTPVQTDDWLWAIPTPGRDRWDWILASIGGVIGLAISVLLVRLRLLPQSFADYAEWEASVHAKSGADQAVPSVPPVAATTPGNEGLLAPAQPNEGSASLQPVAPDQSTTPAAPPAPTDQLPADLWIQYPHARREMIKEALFLGPCLVLGALGLYLARWLWQMDFNPIIGAWVLPAGTAGAPVWLTVLAGVLLGYLIGGGVVWLVRILGSLAFGKEAMGLGDVHLMAAVGACLGWIDSVLAFFAAAFVGLAWFLLGTAFSGAFRRTMPYGPYLAVATLLVVLGKPLVELGLARLTGQPVNLPP